MRDLARGEAQEAEDDVLDPLLQVVHAVRDRLARLLPEEPEDHGQVVDAERPEGVLVGADHAEVLPVAVDAGHLAELARVDELLHLAEARVVEQQVAGHEDEVAGLGQRDELLHLLSPHRGRLLDEDVLPGFERLLREAVVRRDRRRDHDRLDVVVGDEVVERARHPRARIALRVLRAPRLVGVADPREVGELTDDADDVLPPPADARVGDAGQSFQTFSLVTPARPVALRRSTTSCASSTSCA